MIQALGRVLRRPMMWLLVFTYRDVIALWGRSLGRELRRSGGSDGTRLGELMRRLWGATQATGFAVRPVADDGPIVVATHEVVSVVEVPTQAPSPEQMPQGDALSDALLGR